MFAAAAIPALAGIILSWFALSDIRAGQGRVTGRTAALFGALAWPVTIMAAAALFPMIAVAGRVGPTGHVTALGAWMATLVSATAAVLAVAAVRGTLRWVSERPSSGRFRVIRGLIVILALSLAGFVILGRVGARRTIVMFSGSGAVDARHGAPPFMFEPGDEEAIDPQPALQLPPIEADAPIFPAVEKPASALPVQNVPWLRMTFTSVELRQEAGTLWLAMDWAEHIQGECEHTFRTVENGTDLNALTRKTMFRKEEKDGYEVRHQRIEWRLPAGVEREEAEDFRNTVANEWLQKSLVVRPGDEKRLFQLKVPDRGTITAWTGAKFLGDAP
jgi:hypothetical protein